MSSISSNVTYSSVLRGIATSWRAALPTAGTTYSSVLRGIATRTGRPSRCPAGAWVLIGPTRDRNGEVRRALLGRGGVLIGPTRDRNLYLSATRTGGTGYSSVLRGIATRLRVHQPVRAASTHRSYEGSQPPHGEQPCEPVTYSSVLRGIATRGGRFGGHESGYVLIGPTRDRNTGRSGAPPSPSSTSTHRSYEGSQRVDERPVPPGQLGTHRSYEGSQLAHYDPPSDPAESHRSYEGSQHPKQNQPPGCPGRYSSVLRGIATSTPATRCRWRRSGTHRSYEGSQQLPRLQPGLRMPCTHRSYEGSQHCPLKGLNVLVEQILIGPTRDRNSERPIGEMPTGSYSSVLRGIATW